MKYYLPAIAGFTFLLATVYAAFSAAPAPAVTVQGKVISVYDGDTLTVEVTRRMRVRLLGVSAPEIRTTDAAEKKLGLEFKELAKRLADGKGCTVQIPLHTDIGDSTTLSRVLGTVWIEGDNESLNKRMDDAIKSR